MKFKMIGGTGKVTDYPALAITFNHSSCNPAIMKVLAKVGGIERQKPHQWATSGVRWDWVNMAYRCL
jgi:hypothetical protein